MLRLSKNVCVVPTLTLVRISRHGCLLALIIVQSGSVVTYCMSLLHVLNLTLPSRLCAA